MPARWLLRDGFVAVPPAIAHHSGAGFDSDKMMELTGTIKEFQFTNPHTWIQIIVEDVKGQKVEWSLEWGSPNNLGRQGIRPSTFPAGAKVTMRLRPMLNGAPAGALRRREVPRRQDRRSMGEPSRSSVESLITTHRGTETPRQDSKASRCLNASV